MVYTVNNDKVRIITKYIDSVFVRDVIKSMLPDGSVKKIPVARVKDGLNAEIDTFKLNELYIILMSKYGKLFKDKALADKLLKQIIKDWYKGKITKDGLLSVNHF